MSINDVSTKIYVIITYFNQVKFGVDLDILNTWEYLTEYLTLNNFTM